MGKLSRFKQLLGRLYSAVIRSESQYAFLVRWHRHVLLQSELEDDPKLLTPFGWSGYSQNDEDGIVQEIFRRIGTTDRRFFEFGAGDPLCNTGTYLLLSGWSGEWVDASPLAIREIQSKFRAWLQSGHLRVSQSFITPDNINALMKHLPQEFDFLVIDIDGNDYHVWKAITAKPRVVMIEYNATFRPPDAVVQPYVKEPFWRGENFYGASLNALEYLGREKGYCLVACNFAGTNAFFVRETLVGDRFSPPFTAKHHYREQWIDSFNVGYHRQTRSAGPGIRYEKVEPARVPPDTAVTGPDPARHD